jgi:hypothetical protein
VEEDDVEVEAQEQEEEEEEPLKIHSKEVEEEENNGGDGEFQDQTIACKDCGDDFIFSIGEQEFYASKGFDNLPVRCKACKDAKKDRMNGGSGGGGGRGMYSSTCIYYYPCYSINYLQ